MSDVKIPGGMTVQTPSEMPVPDGQMPTGLNVDAPLVQSPVAKAPGGARDGFAGNNSGVHVAPQDGPQETAEMREMGNPFKGLATQADAVVLSLVENAFTLEEGAEMPPEMLQALTNVQLMAGPERVALFDKVRKGVMLLSIDVPSLQGVDTGAVRELGALVNGYTEGGNTDHIESLHGRALAGASAGMDIHSYVQAVLRESYLEQSAVLMDYADKVKFYNEQKKLVREELTSARETRTNWTGIATGDETWMAENGFPAKTLDDNGEWRHRIADADDVAAYQAGLQAIESGETVGGPGSMGSMADYEAFASGESRLKPWDVRLMDDVLSGPSAEWIEENIGAISQVVGKMNEAEFEQYVLAPDGSANVLAGVMTQDMEYVRSFLENLSPVQTLFLVSKRMPGNEIDGDDSQLGGIEGDDAIGVAAGTAATAGAGGAVGVAALQGTTAGAALGPIGSLVGSFFGMIGAALGAGGAAGHILDDSGLVRGLNAAQEGQVARNYMMDFQNAAQEAGVEWGGDITQQAAFAILEGFKARHAGSPNPAANHSSESTAPGVGQKLYLHTPAELDTYIEGLEEQLSSIGDDAQLANVDLQNALQKQQQTMQQMSNIAKMLHDTAMAVIRKISG